MTTTEEVHSTTLPVNNNELLQDIRFTIKRTFIRYSQRCTYSSGMATIALEELQGYAGFLVQAQFYHTCTKYFLKNTYLEI